ncbi:hypothetical protein [Lactobacillus sp. PSON]|uniref:hypothetical protein n=1 Tax=Lactobacillus sp. PSON TaxID=3455454 RepID=UPI004042A434
MTPNYQRRTLFWLRFSGWFCLLPASAYISLLQMTTWSTYSYLYVAEVVISVLFGVYILTTATSKKWKNPSNIMKLMIFAIIFTSLVVFIPLWFAYANCRKINN